MLNKKAIRFIGPLLALVLTGCNAGAGQTVTENTAVSGDVGTVSENDNQPLEENVPSVNQEELSEYMRSLGLMKSYKTIGNHNPVMTQRFGADPYAMVYDGRVYLYMTGDDLMYTGASIKDNDYSNIDTICVISSADLVNWTDHGTVYAAGKNGQATWGNNSWAPASAWKIIDGKPKFFLYFANNGNGIAVLTADSPTGPFTDPIGGPLISRSTPNCSDVTWLFDPAVLMDDDGSAYIYVGGGIPSSDMAADPGTARVAKLGDDMISLASDPVPIDNVAYLFEDSGINKIGDKYYYSYCSNFSVTSEAEKELGFGGGEIITMVSDDPMGPFTLCGSVLKNPGAFFGAGGNNHHCIFEFEGNWYITYHARLLEQAMELTGGYRSTNIDVLNFDDEGAPAATRGTQKGVTQVGYFDPYSVVPAATFGNMAGLETVQYGEEAGKYGSGDMIVTGVSEGDWLCVYGADFGNDGPEEFTIEVRRSPDAKDTDDICAIRVTQDKLFGSEPFADILLEEVMKDGSGNEFTEITVPIDINVTGVHDIYMIFAGSGYEIKSWSFN